MLGLASAAVNGAEGITSADVIVVGGTPAGITASIAAAREGRRVILLERTRHVGGLPANGLGATDIATRNATGGLFTEFVRRNRDHYSRVYGESSSQVADSRDGYRFEPSVAARAFAAMLAEESRVSVRLQRQFDALPANVVVEEARLTEILVLNRDNGASERYRARVFIDATYEGDLAAAAGVPYRIGREGSDEYQEPMAGQLYKQWGGPVGEGSSGRGDNAVQAYNYRLPLTKQPDNRTEITQPADYRREDYISIADDIRMNRSAGPAGHVRKELEWNGIGRVVNMVVLPNGKTDANNQHAAFVSTDLPEENWPWPTASWVWRDRYAQRLRDYTLGLLWFIQNDLEVPADVRAQSRAWGLAKDEYVDNGHFPRQVYVREARRIVGEYVFTAHDALPVAEGSRPPIHRDSVTASHYPLDSHAVRKRESGRAHLDGFFSYATMPYTVPYRVIVPKKIDGLLVPVAASATHIGFSTLRMEPCWMALGEAAGTAADLAIARKVTVRRLDVVEMQLQLLRRGAVLMYFPDLRTADPYYSAAQFLGLQGVLKGWEARTEEPITETDGERWARDLQVAPAPPISPGMTRGAYMLALFRTLSEQYNAH